MATKPSNANPGLTINPVDVADKALASPPADQREVLQALLAFSTLHEQIRRKRTEEARRYATGMGTSDDAWEFEKFVLDEVLQLVAERAQAITGAHGIAIALAEGDEIICRASVGAMAPDRGMRLDAKAGFSGACFRTGRIIRCDDSEKDPRVNLEACRRLGTRSMVAVPLQGQGNVLGLLVAFSTVPYGFKDTHVRSLHLLAELILAALKPEDEEKMTRAAKVAAAELQTAELDSLRQIPLTAPPPQNPSPAPNPLPMADWPSSIARPSEPEIPLELASESIAPALPEDDSSVFRQGAFGALAVVLVLALVGGGLWWGFHRANGVTASSANLKQPTTANSQPTIPAPSSTTPPTTGLQAADQNESITPTGTPLVTGIEHHSGVGTSTVIIDLQDQVQYEAHRLTDPDRVYFDLMDTSLSPGLNGKVIEVKDGLIGRVRIAQPSENVTRVVLDTQTGSTFSVSLEQNPYRLVIEVRSRENSPQPNANVNQTAAPAPSNPAASSETTKEDAQVRPHGAKLRIVIDPGHGGWDLGTIGREGLLEKNLVLEVAQRLGTMLEKNLGAEVVYTRKDDDFVPLEQRAEIANHQQADLFVSVHANYSSLTTARGVETYYSSFFSPPEAREIEFRENGEAGKLTRAKLTGVQLKTKVEESRKLANSVQHALHGTLASQSSGIRDRGVREASFVVLTGTVMPSVLAEISFVSSPADEEKLRNTEYRQQIAEALYQGIERFESASHKVKIASAAPRLQGN